MFINPKPVLKQYYDQGLELDLGRDPHYNAFSNDIVGECIIEKLVEKYELI